MPETKLNLNWSAVEKALAEGTYSGYKMGILEAEKLFADFLTQKKIPGKDTDKKLKYVSGFLSRSEQLKYARQMSERIVRQPHFEISQEETKQAIRGYWQAMLDLEEAIATLSTAQKIKSRINFYKERAIKKMKVIAMIFAGLILLILFFNETGIGKQSVLAIAAGVHYLIFTAGPWILGGIVAFSLLWIGWKILAKRGKEF